MRLPLLALVFAAALPSLSTAEDLYRCAIAQKSANGNWLPPELVIGHQPGAAEGVVFDGIIKHFAGKPLTAKVDTDNAKRITFTWVLKGTSNDANQFADMYYRITIQKSDRRASMTGRALNYLGPYTSNGNCTLTQK